MGVLPEENKRICDPEGRCIWNMSRTQINEFMESIAEAGAEKALTRIGLGDKDAPADLRDLRDLAGSLRDVRKAAWRQVGRFLGLVLLIGFISVFMSKPISEEAIKLLGKG